MSPVFWSRILVQHPPLDHKPGPELNAVDKGVVETFLFWSRYLENNSGPEFTRTILRRVGFPGFAGVPATRIFNAKPEPPTTWPAAGVCNG